MFCSSQHKEIQITSTDPKAIVLQFNGCIIRCDIAGLSTAGLSIGNAVSKMSNET